MTLTSPNVDKNALQPPVKRQCTSKDKDQADSTMSDAFENFTLKTKVAKTRPKSMHVTRQLSTRRLAKQLRKETEL